MAAFILRPSDDNFDVLIERVEKPEQAVGGESFQESPEQRRDSELVVPSGCAAWIWVSMRLSRVEHGKMSEIWSAILSCF